MAQAISSGVSAQNTPITMSSLDIAKLTGKRHDNVVRDIQTTLAEAGIPFLSFEERQKYGANNTRLIYRLPRAECDLVVSGYSVKYRWAIIQKWHELSAQEAKRTIAQANATDAAAIAGKVAAQVFADVLASLLANGNMPESARWLVAMTERGAIARPIALNAMIADPKDWAKLLSSEGWLLDKHQVRELACAAVRWLEERKNTDALAVVTASSGLALSRVAKLSYVGTSGAEVTA